MIKTKKLNKYSILFIINILKRLHISTYLLVPFLFSLLILPKQLIYIVMLISLIYSISKLYKNKSNKINYSPRPIVVNTDLFNNVESTDISHESEFKDTLFINQVVNKKEYYTLHDFEVDWKVYIEETIISITVVKLFYYDNRTIAKIYVLDNSIDIYFDDSITLEMLYYKLQECSSFSDLSSL